MQEKKKRIKKRYHLTSRSEIWNKDELLSYISCKILSAKKSVYPRTKDINQKLEFFIPTKTRQQIFSKNQKMRKKLGMLIYIFYIFYRNFPFSEDEKIFFLEIKELLTKKDFFHFLKMNLRGHDLSFLDHIQKEKVYFIKDSEEGVNMDQELKEIFIQKNVAIKVSSEFYNRLNRLARNLSTNTRIDNYLFIEYIKDKITSNRENSYSNVNISNESVETESFLQGDDKNI